MVITKKSHKRPKKEKRYFFNVIEECVQNPEFQWGRGGRIEVSEVGTEWPIFEARWFVPAEFAEAFREVFDFKHSDHLPDIRFKDPRVAVKE